MNMENKQQRGMELITLENNLNDNDTKAMTAGIGMMAGILGILLLAFIGVVTKKTEEK